MSEKYITHEGWKRSRVVGRHELFTVDLFTDQVVVSKDRVMCLNLIFNGLLSLLIRGTNLLRRGLSTPSWPQTNGPCVG